MRGPQDSRERQVCASFVSWGLLVFTCKQAWRYSLIALELSYMITGEIKNQIDAIWDTYWVGGITNPMSVLEQMTYLFFMKMIDDAQLKKEAEANILGVKIANPTFKDGMWHNPETDNDVPYNSLRWHVFKNMEATQMFS